jgi:hypothetical protein
LGCCLLLRVALFRQFRQQPLAQGLQRTHALDPPGDVVL